MLAFKLNAQHNVKFTGIALKGDSVLSWTVTNVPEDPFIYIIQQYRWNSWVDLDTIYTLLKTDTVFRSRIKRYEITGENKFRVRAVGNTMLIYSKALTFNSNRPSSKNIEGRYNKKSPTIQFGREELYRIYDKNGKMLKQGYAREVSVGELPKDVYYINYGERTGEFIIY
jgi:hypothetical protein